MNPLTEHIHATMPLLNDLEDKLLRRIAKAVLGRNFTESDAKDFKIVSYLHKPGSYELYYLDSPLGRIDKLFEVGKITFTPSTAFKMEYPEF